MLGIQLSVCMHAPKCLCIRSHTTAPRTTHEGRHKPSRETPRPSRRHDSLPAHLVFPTHFPFPTHLPPSSHPFPIIFPCCPSYLHVFPLAFDFAGDVPRNGHIPLLWSKG